MQSSSAEAAEDAEEAQRWRWFPSRAVTNRMRTKKF